MAHPLRHEPEATVRLAENEGIAIDLCPCGALALHLGPLSLRLDSDTVASLLQTLGLALARRRELVLQRYEEARTQGAHGCAGGDPTRGQA